MKIRYSGYFEFIKILTTFFVRLIFFSKKKMGRKIISYLPGSLFNGEVDCKFLVSGRAAISFLLSELKIQRNIHTVLIPEYICDVVALSAKYAGLSIEYYSLTDNLEINWFDVEQKIKHKDNLCLIFASYFNVDNCTLSNINTLRALNPNCYIILDESQNLFNLDSLRFLDYKTAVILSFNNKSTYGFLGGALIHNKQLFKNYDSQYRKLKFSEEVTIFLAFMRTTFKLFYQHLFITFSPKLSSIESNAQGKYSVEPREISKTSITVAYNEIVRKERILEILNYNYLQISRLEELGYLNGLRKTGASSLMPFVIVEDILINGLNCKPPYIDLVIMRNTKSNRLPSIIVSNIFKIKILESK